MTISSEHHWSATCLEKRVGNTTLRSKKRIPVIHIFQAPIHPIFQSLKKRAHSLRTHCLSCDFLTCIIKSLLNRVKVSINRGPQIQPMLIVVSLTWCFVGPVALQVPDDCRGQFLHCGQGSCRNASPWNQERPVWTHPRWYGVEHGPWPHLCGNHSIPSGCLQ